MLGWVGIVPDVVQHHNRQTRAGFKRCGQIYLVVSLAQFYGVSALLGRFYPAGDQCDEVRNVCVGNVP